MPVNAYSIFDAEEIAENTQADIEARAILRLAADKKTHPAIVGMFVGLAQNSNHAKVREAGQFASRTLQTGNRVAPKAP